MPKRILIVTGGTGGHIYPAMGLAQQFLREEPEAQILFVGGGLHQNRYFDRKSFPFHSVACGAFTSKNPLTLLKSCAHISRGLWESRRIIRQFKPDVAVGFGSYYCFPPLLAAKWQSIPIILHEANSIPGKVNRLLAPYASAVGVHFPHTLGLVKGKGYEVGMPLRTGFHLEGVARSESRRYFGLSDEMATLLIFGGSQGARTINQLMIAVLASMKSPLSLQLIHITGEEQQTYELREEYKKLGIVACVKTFEERMDLAWQSADMAISRAGASSIAEQLEFEVPGILIPFARAADDHQNFNADFLVETVGSAVKIQEKDLSVRKVAQELTQLLDMKTLKEMKARMGAYKKNIRTRDLYALVNEIIGK
jgi:UDP-N-acetylglucosamine--N-acetylmuramyl-(pentapeptide) pyrophosphoryl-undecaprenol N-acetylglucosamine transferase